MYQEIPQALPSQNKIYLQASLTDSYMLKKMFECNSFTRTTLILQTILVVLFNKAITLWIWPTVVLGLHYCIRVGTL